MRIAEADRKKTGIIIGCAMLAAVVIIGVIYFMLSGDDFRSAEVFEVNGSAVITREGSSYEAVEGMNLQAGDTVKVSAGDSYLRLVLDEDKYILLEPETEITLVLSGNSKNSTTRIELHAGAVINEIQNKLSDGSGYNVNTPVSTMAVRGTVFRVSMEQRDNGEYYVHTAVFEGLVDSRLVQEDGTLSEEAIEIPAGKSAAVQGKSGEAGIVYEGDIMYDDLPAVVLEYLVQMKEAGKLDDLPVTTQEIQNMIEEIEQKNSIKDIDVEEDASTEADAGENHGEGAEDEELSATASGIEDGLVAIARTAGNNRRSSQEEATPELQVNSEADSANKDNKPSSTNNKPSSTNNTPSSSSNIPSSTDNTPPSTDNTPPSTDNTPPSTDNTPPSADNTPPSTDNTSSNDNNSSEDNDVKEDNNKEDSGKGDNHDAGDNNDKIDNDGENDKDKNDSRLYNVAFVNALTDEEITSVEVKHDECVTAPQPLLTEGYHFTGWYLDKAGTLLFPFDNVITQDTVIYGIYERISYTVSLVYLQGSPSSISVKAGETLEEKSIYREIEGYIFSGWFLDAEYKTAWDFNRTITENVTLYGQYSPSAYQVTIYYDYASNDYVVAYVKAGETLEEESIYQERVGYIFSGWFLDAEYKTAWDFNKTITENVTLYGQYSPAAYQVTFFDCLNEREVEVKTVLNGGTVTAHVLLDSDDGNIFKGWYKDTEANELFDFEAPITGDTIIYGIYEKSQYTVTFVYDSYNQTTYVIACVGAGETLQESQYRRDEQRFTFIGWFLDEDYTETWNFDTPITKDMAIYAQYRHKVSFINSVNNYVIAVKYVKYQKNVEKPEDVDMEGYTFKGWYTDAYGNTPFNFDSMWIEYNYTIYACFDKE